jgi:hypothetical protein
MLGVPLSGLPLSSAITSILSLSPLYPQPSDTQKNLYFGFGGNPLISEGFGRDFGSPEFNGMAADPVSTTLDDVPSIPSSYTAFLLLITVLS